MYKGVKWYKGEWVPGWKERYIQAFKPHTFSLVWFSANLFCLRKCINVTRYHLYWPRERKNEGKEKGREGEKKKEGKGKGNLIQIWCFWPMLDNTFWVESPAQPHASCLIPSVSNCPYKEFLTFTLHPTLFHPFPPASLHTLHVLYTPHKEYQPSSKYFSGKMLANIIS